ncbi:MAG: ROK family transcriptional regulator [Treponema sp.]|jgi:glucokinase|nr:ROK family transcriptional regulator [Treponema sp.]
MLPTAAMPVDVKLINRVSILEVFRSNGTLSVHEVSQKTGISRLTIKKFISVLLNNGLIRSAGKGPPDEMGGPRPELFEFSCDLRNFCLIIEGDYLAAAVCDQQNHILAKKRIEFGAASMRDFLAMIWECWESLSKECGLSKEQLYGVILASDGVVDDESKILIHRAKSPHWGTNIPLGDYLQEMFKGARILIESAIKIAGASEILWGQEAVKGKWLIVIYTNNGISSCRINNSGTDFSKNIEIGRLGHVMVAPDDEEECGCGSHGCLDIMIGEGRIRRIIKEKAPGSGKSVLTENSKIEDVFTAAGGGDALGRELVDYIARMFFYALRNYLTLVSADILIFQGTYARAGDYFFCKLREYFTGRPYLLPQAVPGIICDKRSLVEIHLAGVSSAVSNYYFNNDCISGLKE